MLSKVATPCHTFHNYFCFPLSMRQAFDFLGLARILLGPQSNSHETFMMWGYNHLAKAVEFFLALHWWEIQLKNRHWKSCFLRLLFDQFSYLGFPRKQVEAKLIWMGVLVQGRKRDAERKIR